MAEMDMFVARKTPHRYVFCGSGTWMCRVCRLAFAHWTHQSDNDGTSDG